MDQRPLTDPVPMFLAIAGVWNERELIMSEVPKAPTGLKRSGSAPWKSILADYELDAHEERLLAEMCRTVDALDALDMIVRREGVIEPGTGRAHPALVEARQLRIAYARLCGALRLPAGDETGDDQRAESRRRRGGQVGVRGVYRLGAS